MNNKKIKIMKKLMLTLMCGLMMCLTSCATTYGVYDEYSPVYYDYVIDGIVQGDGFVNDGRYTYHIVGIIPTGVYWQLTPIHGSVRLYNTSRIYIGTFYPTTNWVFYNHSVRPPHPPKPHTHMTPPPPHRPGVTPPKPNDRGKVGGNRPPQPPKSTTRPQPNNKSKVGGGTKPNTRPPQNGSRNNGGRRR